MAVKWSREAACYVWDCIFGCKGFDYEGRGEAERAFDTHQCPMGS